MALYYFTGLQSTRDIRPFKSSVECLAFRPPPHTQVVMLLYQGGRSDHMDMQPQLSKGVGYWELGDTWESTVFTYFMVMPLVRC